MVERPARVGVLTTSYPRFDGDPAGSFVEGMVEALQSRGHRLEVLAPRDEVWTARDGVHPVPYAPRPLERTFYRAGVADNARQLRAWPGLLTFPPALFAAARRKRRSWDGVLAHFGVPCGTIAARLGLPSLTVWHSADVHLASRLLPLPGARALLGLDRGDHWFVRRDHRDRLRPRRAHVQPMGARVLPMSRREARAALGLGDARRLVLFLGRRVPVKGLDVLGRAMRGLDAELVVAGEGPVPPPPGARVLGRIGEPTKSQWLHAADALVIPSIRLRSGRTEGAPVVLREAWAAGTPVVTTDVLDGVTDGEDALVVPAGDAAPLREAILRVLDDPTLADRLRAGGRRHDTSWARVAAAVERVLGLRTPAPSA